MPEAVSYDVTATLVAYRNKKNNTWLTLVDLTCDLMHLARHMRTDVDRCLAGDMGARLDERPLSAMPDVASVRPINDPDDSKSADHCFDTYVHASDAAAVLRVHMAGHSCITFSAALTGLLADLRAYSEAIGFDFTEISRMARKSYRIECQKAQ